MLDAAKPMKRKTNEAAVSKIPDIVEIGTVELAVGVGDAEIVVVELTSKLVFGDVVEHPLVVRVTDRLHCIET